MACTKEIEVEQAYYESEVTVDGWIAYNDYANVLLTNSSPFLTEYDSSAIRNTFLNDAKVTLLSSKGESEVLTLFREDEFFPPFVYRSIDIKGEEGVSYEIKIVVDGKLIESSTSIPKLPIIHQVLPVSTSDTTMQIDIELDNDVDETNYYYAEIKVKGIDASLHASSFPIYTDVGINGEITTYRIYSSEQADPLNLYEPEKEREVPSYEFHNQDTIYLRFSSIDEVSYRVLNDIYLDQVNSSNPFSFINREANFNIEGGIGRWTGLASKNYIIYTIN